MVGKSTIHDMDGTGMFFFTERKTKKANQQQPHWAICFSAKSQEATQPHGPRTKPASQGASTRGGRTSEAEGAGLKFSAGHNGTSWGQVPNVVIPRMILIAHQNWRKVTLRISKSFFGVVLFYYSIFYFSILWCSWFEVMWTSIFLTLPQKFKQKTPQWFVWSWLSFYSQVEHPWLVLL